MSVPALSVAGNTLQADGKLTKLVGVADFSQFKRWLAVSGKEVLVRPIITERTNLAREAGYTGPLTARVFRCAASWNAFALDPWSYPMSAVTEFTQFYNSLGWYVDWTSGDNQVCFPLDGDKAQLDGPKGFNQHTNEFTSALIGTQYVWNVANEPWKNGFGHQDLPVPPPWTSPVQYSGDYGDHRDQSKDLACINLHTDRSTEGVVQKWVGKSHESAPYLWPVGKPIFYDEGMGADEVSKPGSRSNVPAYFGIQASSIAMVNAIYFHSSAGQRSDGFGPVVTECYKAFMRGAAAGLKV
jgi:hypothetical protein